MFGLRQLMRMLHTHQTGGGNSALAKLVQNRATAGQAVARLRFGWNSVVEMVQAQLMPDADHPSQPGSVVIVASFTCMLANMHANIRFLNNRSSDFSRLPFA